MKKYLLLFSLLIIGLSSCQKEATTADQAAIDDAKIQAYIKANKITATKDASGVYYQIITAGGATKPTTASTLQVTYKGHYVNGEQYDAGNVATLKLSERIKGWQIALPKIGAGGRITFLVPSAQGYGTAGNGNVPANAVLVFTVDLIGFY